MLLLLFFFMNHIFAVALVRPDVHCPAVYLVTLCIPFRFCDLLARLMPCRCSRMQNVNRCDLGTERGRPSPQAACIAWRQRLYDGCSALRHTPSARLTSCLLAGADGDVLHRGAASVGAGAVGRAGALPTRLAGPQQHTAAARPGRQPVARSEPACCGDCGCVVLCQACRLGMAAAGCHGHLAHAPAATPVPPAQHQGAHLPLCFHLFSTMCASCST